MTIYQHIRNFPPEGKTGPKKGQAFLWCTLVGRKRRKKKSEHHILYWDKTNYLGENCLQNHPIRIHTSHSVIPKGHPHYRNVCCPHWKGHGMLSAAQTLNNWMTSPRKLAKQTWGKKKRGEKKQPTSGCWQMGRERMLRKECSSPPCSDVGTSTPRCSHSFGFEGAVYFTI